MTHMGRPGEFFSGVLIAVFVSLLIVLIVIGLVALVRVIFTVSTAAPLR